jgi:hypothetical protein
MWHVACGLYLLFVIWALVTLVLLLVQGRRLVLKLLSARILRTEELMMLAAGMSLSGLSLHAWVDFNLRIRALAMFGALSMDVFLRRRDALHRERKD